MLPSAVIFPVACKLPEIKVLLFNCIVPVPLGVILILVFVPVALIVFVAILKLPTFSIP